MLPMLASAEGPKAVDDEHTLIGGDMADRGTFKVSEIQPNPFRKIDSYPFHEDKLEALRESIRSTGFWDNVVGRLNEDGEPEIAYGHHRLEAVKRELGPVAEVELILRDLTDDDMLRIMARENMEEWGTSVWIEMETVKSAVEAYAEGRIHLPDVPRKTTRGIRYAPGFMKDPFPGDHDHGHQYTGTTLAEFLGWMKPNGRPSPSVEVALSALEMVEAGVLEEDDLKGLSREAAKEAIRGARRVKRRKEKAAEVHEEQASEAEKEAESADNDKDRERARRRAKASREKAQKLKDEGKRAERKAAKTVTRKLREGSIGTKQARDEAEKAAGGKESPAEKRVYANEVADKLCREIINVLDPEHHRVAVKVEEMIRLRDMLSERHRQEIAKNLERVAERATQYAENIRAEKTERQLVGA